METSPLPPSELTEKRQQISDIELEQIRRSLEGLRFGAVQIIVQDGVVVQIDRTEKRRIRRSGASANG